ncbi:cell shape determination protein CcmA [Paenibacillus psychroresistens]|uniref:Cell shape determination protein CcmA n=1 Tax=Paenibacillus psychroresistens TaxID=1778678 RepID=A0A6B8RBW1_9BACL|nr:cell shape determination protein CcmA [Paenibacillus psychroresistens]QGQ93849.1 cell shape determination protein CcmA [Paenibacillus psychroresistens]
MANLIKGKPVIGNLKSTGETSSIGGKYNKVNMIGEGKIDGDVDCIQLKCIGTLDMEGHLKAGEIRIVGTCSISGDIQADAIRITGSVVASGNANFKKLQCSGSIEARGNLHSEHIDLNGHLITKGDCEVEVFKGRGIFTIGGMLNVGELDIKLYHNCEAKEIGAEQINIRRASLINHLNFFFKPSSSATLTASIIEGDEIYLEHTKAKIVRGKNVTIGPGCDIGLVEYEEQFIKVKDSLVKENHKI